MIEWVKAGRQILASRKDLSPSEVKVMQAQIRVAELTGLAFHDAEALRIAALSGRESESINKKFAELYPNYASSRFSYDLRATLAIDSPEAARYFNHGYIGTEHLLLGLLHKGSPAEPILRAHGVDTQRVQSAVDTMVGRDNRTVTKIIPLALPAQAVLMSAISEAERLKDPEVNGKHLLLGLIKEKGYGGIVIDILESMGVNLEEVRQTVYSTLGV